MDGVNVTWSAATRRSLGSAPRRGRSVYAARCASSLLPFLFSSLAAARFRSQILGRTHLELLAAAQTVRDEISSTADFDLPVPRPKRPGSPARAARDNASDASPAFLRELGSRCGMRALHRVLGELTPPLSIRFAILSVGSFESHRTARRQRHIKIL